MRCIARERGAGFVAGEPDLAREPATGERGSATRRRAARRGQPAGDRADGGAARRVRGGRSRSSSAAASGRASDGYDPAERSAPEAAEAYHATQIATFADTAADLVTAITMTYAEEAIGIARAAVGGGHAGRRSRSRSRPTAGCRAASRWARRSSTVDDETDGGAGVLHGQLRAPDALRATCSTSRRRGTSACAASGPTRRRRATPSWTRPTELDAGDPVDLAPRYAELRDTASAA